MENAPAHTGIDGNAPDEQQHQADPVQQETPSPGMMPPPAMTLMPPEFVMPHTQLELGQSMVRAAYPYPDPYFGGIVAAYGPQAVIHPHMLGVPHAGVPLPSDAIEEPVYVNAKQYNGILRRRQSRAKAESENKLIKNRKIQKISRYVWKKKYQPGDLLQTSNADPAVQGLEVMLEVQKSQSKINQAFKCIVFITRRKSIALQQLEGPTYIGGDGSQIIMERFQ